MAEILYADDDDLFREMVRSVLEGSGHTVRLAANGTEALAEVRSSPPDLVLLDYLMGDPDGFDVCREIKRDPKIGHIPVLILTAEGAIDDRLEGFEAGADDYLSKPFDPRELKARVKALLELSRRGLARNPSSGLPGGDAIAEEFERRCATGRPFAVCYLDLDNFKPFGDRFGFPVSDAVIAVMGELLLETTQGADDFTGHIGGDDFIVFCEVEGARERVEEVQAKLRQRLADLVPPEVASSGHYTGKDRSGQDREFPLTAISAGILYVQPSYRGSFEALGKTAAEVKDAAKRKGPGRIVEVQVPGNSEF